MVITTLGLFAEKIIKRNKNSYYILVADYEVKIPWKAEGDIITILQDAYGHISLEEDILEDDKEFYEGFIKDVKKLQEYIKVHQDEETANRWFKLIEENAIKTMENYVPSEKSDDEDEEEEESVSMYDMDYLDSFVSDDYQNTRGGEKEVKTFIPMKLDTYKNTLILTFIKGSTIEEAKAWVNRIIVESSGYVIIKDKIETDEDGNLVYKVKLDCDFTWYGDYYGEVQGETPELI